MKHTYLLFLLCITPFLARAQQTAAPLKALNDAFAGKVIFKIDNRDRLIMDHQENGQRFRQDIAPIMELDPDAIVYSLGEDAVVMNCSAKKSQCISKEIFKLDMVRISSRSTLPRPPDDAEGARSIKVLEELIRAVQAKQPVADETSKDGQRRKGR